MNEYQKKLLEIAFEFINVCEKLGLSYYAIAGTCLGAIRHNGFIPWDDDMDFGMPREDYETFAKEGQKYLPDNLFVQTNSTDKHYYYPFMKIRDSNTTAIEKVLQCSKINHGVWIDIFPLDGIPQNIKKCRRVERLDRCFIRRRFLFEGYHNSLLDKVEKAISILLFPRKGFALRTSIKISKKYNFWSSKRFWWNWGSRLQHSFKTEYFKDYIVVKFETIHIRVPKLYELYLNDHFGDWRKYPPIEKRNSGHSFAIIDLNSPFTKYSK